MTLLPVRLQRRVLQFQHGRFKRLAWRMAGVEETTTLNNKSSDNKQSSLSPRSLGILGETTEETTLQQLFDSKVIKPGKTISKPSFDNKILIALPIDNLVKDSDIDGPSLLTLGLITYGVSTATIS
jgi:hypothetical protein